MARGSVVRKDSGWTARWDEPGARGRRQRRKGGFASKKDADRFLRDQLARLDNGTYATPSTITVAAYLTQRLGGQESRVGPMSVTAYRGAVRCYIEPGIGSVRRQELSTRQVSAFYRSLERKGLSASTRQIVHAVLRRARSDALREGDLHRNPADWVRAPGRAQAPVQAWTSSELSRFLEHARGRPTLCALATGRHLGHAPRRARRPHLARARP